MRVDHACLLLDRTKLSIKEVATRSGFVNLETFYRAFKRTRDVSPKQHREQCRRINP